MRAAPTFGAQTGARWRATPWRPHSVLKLQLTDEGELDAIRAAAMESLATGRPFARRMRVQHGDGRPRVLDARGDVVYNDAGEAVGLQGFSQDITELARAEQRPRAVAELGPLDRALTLSLIHISEPTVQVHQPTPAIRWAPESTASLSRSSCWARWRSVTSTITTPTRRRSPSAIG